jgi:hypothetical protein
VVALGFCGGVRMPAIRLGSTSSRGAKSGIADPFNGHIDEFRIAHVQRSDGWSEDISRQVPRLPENP